MRRNGGPAGRADSVRPPLPAQALTVQVNHAAELDSVDQVIDASGTVTCSQCR